MSTGAVIGTVLATIVVFGGGAFSLIWFVLRKKELQMEAYNKKMEDAYKNKNQITK